jgi:hypothetical protein
MALKRESWSNFGFDFSPKADDDEKIVNKILKGMSGISCSIRRFIIF